MDQPLPAGKFPGDLLASFLKTLDIDEPSILIEARVGEDIAAVDISDEETLVLKSDPITFVSDGLGYYAVLINTNDIATSGARPRWFLGTLLVPPGTTPREIFGILNDMNSLGDNALHCACVWGDLEAARLLVENGININQRGEHGSIPLRLAVDFGFREIADYLIANGADTGVLNLAPVFDRERHTLHLEHLREQIRRLEERIELGCGRAHCSE
jgi:hypothetical protein